MANPPASLEDLTNQFGPHLNYVPPSGWQDESTHPADKLVKTHCCFCGQQCGIQLKVRDDKVIGFEPWENSLSTWESFAPRASSDICNRTIRIVCSTP
jgi:assimilatory nitrate reductase catalytic subunit